MNYRAGWLIVKMIAVATASYSANITVDPELSTHDLPAVRLYNKIMQELPDPSIRPANNVNVPTVIDIEIELQQLVDVNDIEQKIKLIIPTSYSWKSDFVEWKPEEYGGITNINIQPSKIWTPKVFAATSVENLRSPEDLEDMVEVSHNGSMKWLSYKMVTYSCRMNMSRFPTDSHQCQMVMTFMGDKPPSVIFGRSSTKINQYTLPNSEFNVTAFTAISYYSIAMLEVNITRNPSLASTTLISPIIFLSILSPTSLLLPSDDGSKLDIQINAMLAYAVYMMILSDYIPPFADDQRPAIVIQLIATNLVAILYTVVILRISNFDEIAPNKHVYKGFKFVGKLLLIYHPDQACQRRVSIEDSTRDNESEQVHDSTIIKVLSIREECSDEEKTDPLYQIADWLKDKSQADDIKYQWCYITAVFDRISFIAMFAFAIYMDLHLLALTGM